MDIASIDPGSPSLLGVGAKNPDLVSDVEQGWSIWSEAGAPTKLTVPVCGDTRRDVLGRVFVAKLVSA